MDVKEAEAIIEANYLKGVGSDIKGFVLLQSIAPIGEDRDVIAGAEHDEIFLAFDLETVLNNATEEDIVTLAHCGVRIDEWQTGFTMFA